MSIWESLGLAPEQMSHAFYGFIGWAASAVTIRPKGILEAFVSLLVAIVFAEAAADAFAGSIARFMGGMAEDWTKVSAMVVGFGGLALLQLGLNLVIKQVKGKADGTGS
ncbi:hypothetical protein [uncultured Tateyamaria sp.]|uniref:hypothetical protein n=1 Tax=Tateyamaria sp. 1078 TaxID=3417464 RepID=UPI002606EF0A|nr:hypothetical protein [uncultured Tateyamaria sp.]